VKRSLFLRFFLASAATMVAVWLGVLLWEAYVVQARFEQVQAAETKGWTRQILASVGNRHLDTGELRATIERIEAARDRLFTDTGFFKPRWQLQVWRDGALVYGADDALPSADAHWSVWTERDAASGVTVRLAQEFVIAWTFALAGSSHQFAPLLYCFPFLLLTTWLTIRYGMRPLNAISAQIRQRSAADLSPLPVPTHGELAPLVQSTNELMERLGHRLRREQEFLGDAAHQLKTPLAIVQSNAELLVDAKEPALATAARDGLREGVADAVHVVHQLLALARSETQGDADPLDTLDLAELVRKRLALAVGMALPRNIELEFDAPECVPARVRRASMTALVDNLVSNAIKYSPDGGRVEVALRMTGQGILLEVADEGPGITPALRAKVFERFFRVPDQEQGGSGLGLAIVERAAASNLASVRLADGPRGRGLAVQVLIQASLACATRMPSASA